MKTDSHESERQRAILETLRGRPFATVRDLLDVVDASAATIRRDIAKLSQAGVVRKVFGGIAAIEDGAVERLHAKPFEENRVLHVAAKRAIAAAAEALCRDGDAVIVNGGTTCFLFAQRLIHRNLRIYTNSMPVAAFLWERGSCHLVLSGGELHREPGILFTPQRDEPDFYASKLFLGAQGLGAAGILESHPLVVRAIELLVARADEIIVLADSSKFSIRARYCALPLARIGTLITDDGLGAEERSILEAAGVSVIIANGAPPSVAAPAPPMAEARQG